MFDGRPGIQRIVRLGLLGKMILHYTFNAHTSLFSVFFYLCNCINLIDLTHSCSNSVYEICCVKLIKCSVS